MPDNTDRTNSILIVSGSEQFAALIRKALSGKHFETIEISRSASSARRKFMERQYNFIVINSPLQEEFGHELAMDFAERGISSVLMAVPSEVYDNVLDHVTDYGIMVLAKPLSGSLAEKALRFLAAEQKRFRRLEKRVISAEEKMAELRVVSKAKLLLITSRNMTEEEAHRFIGKQAMDHGVTRRRIAEQILDDLEQ